MTLAGPTESATPVEGPFLPASIVEASGQTAPRDAEEARTMLCAMGLCETIHPAVVLELYGGLRIRTGCACLPLRAGTILGALQVLARVYPRTTEFFPDPRLAGEHYRFSINGGKVGQDVHASLSEGDRLILFSASVGG